MKKEHAWFHYLFQDLFHKLFNDLFHYWFNDWFTDVFNDLFHDLFNDLFRDLFHDLFNALFIDLFNDLFSVSGERDAGSQAGERDAGSGAASSFKTKGKQILRPVPQGEAAAGAGYLSSANTNYQNHAASPRTQRKRNDIPVKTLAP